MADHVAFCGRADVPLFSLCAAATMGSGLWFNSVASTKTGRELIAEAQGAKQAKAA